MNHTDTQRRRALIAHAAAKLIAEGLSDYAEAKRKALHRLGFSENAALPDDREIEEELALIQRLYQDGEHSARLTALRQTAYTVMTRLSAFHPYLCGSVLEGTANAYAEIDIQLYPDSAKEVEIYLLNQNIAYEHRVPRSERAEAVLTLNEEEGLVNLVIYPAHDERINFKTRAGKTRARLNLEGVRKMLNDSAR